MANLVNKLQTVQMKLKAPKNQYNSFGEYNYRSAEDILEAVKPVCSEVNVVIMLSDSMIHHDDRHYVEATALFMDCESDQIICATASAREALDRKKMDDSQLTGSASSYARKYALNGLLAIDDTKDADTQAPPESPKKPLPPAQKPVSKQAPHMAPVPENTDAKDDTQKRCWKYLWTKAEQFRDAQDNAGELVTNLYMLQKLIGKKFPSTQAECEKVIVGFTTDLFSKDVPKEDLPF